MPFFPSSSSFATAASSSSTSSSGFHRRHPKLVNMNPSDYPVARSPKRELQGPRPTPLKVRKDSHKIRKPPLAPSHQQHQHQQQPPPPVIIYTVSPKVIHTNPSDFMNLVQRLTGSTSSSSSVEAATSSSASSNPFSFDNSCAISPAARYATIEKTRTPLEGKKMMKQQTSEDFVVGIEMGQGVERTGTFPGILSPGPTTLPPISPNFFSPAFDPNVLGNLFHDLSPMVQGNKYFLEGSFMPSPSSFTSPHFTFTASPTIDLFNHFFDL